MKYPLLSLVPKNFQSYLVGALTRLKGPRALSAPLHRKFTQVFDIDMSEAEKPLENYQTMEEIFTRRLKEGLRPVMGELVSPCDGTLRCSLPLKQQMAIQAKGLTYPIQEFLFADSHNQAPDFTPYWYSSFYLAPHNYHRVHAAFSGRLTSIRYIPGDLWPVNDSFMKVVPRLFCKNERVVFSIQHPSGGKGYLVMVGALHVGRMEIHGAPDFFTNDLLRQFSKGIMRDVHMNSDQEIKAGDELGTFMLGSSVVLVFDRALAEHFNLHPVEKSFVVKMGQKVLN